MRSVQGGGGARCVRRETREKSARKGRRDRCFADRDRAGLLREVWPTRSRKPPGESHVDPGESVRARGKRGGACEGHPAQQAEPRGGGVGGATVGGEGRAGGVDVLRGQRGHSARYSGGSATPRTSCAQSGGVVTGAPWLSVDVRAGVAVAGGRQGAAGPRRGLIPTLRFQNPVGTGTC